ncbi:export associated protein [Streptomyces armeniacus]|uniref:Export associated protein n=1 Tax=Streptomyces armeniacus TaxID=83291 RepID=A0A345XMW1_9ACTN|nr:TerD family protein [Streptomyces armeniacus]AXK32977.1 export associated protein [Streptomyces armeniacus]
MTAELVRGQNHPLPETRLEIRVSAGKPVLAGATLNDEHGHMRDAGWIAHPAEPNLPGLEVSRQAAADHRLAVDLNALPDAVHRVNVLLALPTGVGGPASFGAFASPFAAVTSLDGTEIASYTITGLDAESAVVALELYRRQGAWKVRAVGQGYAGGLAAMLQDQGLPESQQLADTINEAVAAGLARAVAPPPPAARGARQHATQAGAARPAADPQGGTDGRGRPSGGPVPSGTPAPDNSAGAPAGGGGPVDYQHPARRSSSTPSGAGAGAAPPPGPVPSGAGSPAAAASGAGAGAGAGAAAGSGAAGQPAGGPPVPVAGDASGWSMDERLYNQIWGMFEDLARTVAAYRSAVDFADSRREQELDKVLSDPRTRVGPVADAAREEARAKHTQLVDQAGAVLERDLNQLVAEAAVVEPALPPAFARWDNPVWQAYEVPMEVPMALRLGDLTLPERADLRIPMLVRLPLDRGLWIDSGNSGSGASLVSSDELRRLAVETAVAIAARLVAVYPVDDFTLNVIDPAGSAATSLVPLLESGALREPPAVGAAGVTQMLERLTQRVDLVQMAVRSGATSSLPPELDTAEQLLIVHDFPHGFDDRAVTQLRYLADEGPAVGVNLLMVADREDARAYGPVLDPLWRSLLRITPVPDDHLADPWVGHAWTYEPPLVPSGSRVVPQVLQQVATARQAYGR